MVLLRCKEPQIVTDDRVRSNGKVFWIRDIQFLELNLAVPYFAQEVLEDFDRKLFGRTATIAEAKWCKAYIVAHW
jgi:hypothetical protein